MGNPAGSPSGSLHNTQTAPPERALCRIFSGAGLFALPLVLLLSSVRALQFGGGDFSVFHGAWRLVLEGKGMDVYHQTSDRFLYSPGFAWLLAPFGLIPRSPALLLFCLAKAAAVLHLLRIARRRLNPGLSLGIYAWGALLVTRALLIDFQYGQVNTLIVWALCAGLDLHFDSRRGSRARFLAWAGMSAVAVFKVIALPVLLIPWLQGLGRKSEAGDFQPAARVGTLFGALLALFSPVFFQGVENTGKLLQEWKVALSERGLPLETHNQSMMAFLLRYFGGKPSPIIALEKKILYGWSILGETSIWILSLGWAAACGALILLWIWWGTGPEKIEGQAPLNVLGVPPTPASLSPESLRMQWIAILVGLLILPSHLVWKPYFVFGLPLGIAAIARTPGDRFRGLPRAVWIAAVFALMNLTSFDVLGPDLGGRLESASILLWAHLLLLAGSIWRIRSRRAASSPVSTL